MARKKYFHFSVLFVVIVIFMLSFNEGSAGNQSIDLQEYPAPGMMVDIGTNKLHLYCVGNGSPTVILEHGVGANSLDWREIQSEISLNSKVCAYDRAGYGWSEPNSSSRTPSDFAETLHQLIQAAGLQPPFILVAHSFGGIVVTSYAAEYPDNVAGLVLVDALHPGMFADQQKPLRLTPVGEKFWYTLLDFYIWLAQKGIIRFLIPLNIVPWTQTPVNFSEHLREVRTATLSASNHWVVFKSEMFFVEEHMNDFSVEDLHGIMDGKPVYVFYGGESAPIPVDLLDSKESEFVWASLQSDWKMISSNSHILEIPDADHNSLLFHPPDYQKIVSVISTLQQDFSGE